MVNQHPDRILGAVLAGGRSTRFGSDKSAALWQGRTLLDHAAFALSRHCDAVVICAGGRFSQAGRGEFLDDRPARDLGPLGGLCAALHHASTKGYDAVLTVPVDALPAPDVLRDLLSGAEAAVLADHWLFGLWPSTLSASLEAHLETGARSVLSWVEKSGVQQVRPRSNPPLNINDPQTLATLERGSALGEAAEVSSLKQLDFATCQVTDLARIVPVETPVAIEFNGIGYAVMMATPVDLDDFVTGFVLAEGLCRPEEIETVQLHETQGGWVARANLPPRCMPRLLERARTRVSESSCGICGIDSIAAALAPLPPLLAAPPAIDPSCIHKALSALPDHQHLGAATGAVHAAAFCSFDGEIVMLREDVGRHNALDKLIGALARRSVNGADGFVLLSARCSQELVEKTVRAGIPMLATISAPSSLAISRAREAGLTLLALARSDTALIVNDPHRRF